MEETTQNTQVMHREDARVFANRYRCSVCWGGLVCDVITNDIHDENYLNASVHCSNPECTGSDFVTAKYVEKRRSENDSDFYEAKRNLKEALGLPDPNAGKTADQLLHELGF